jgi:hypothetical protein
METKMKGKMSPQSKSFLVLLILILVGSYLCLTMWWLYLSQPTQNHSWPLGGNFQMTSYRPNQNQTVKSQTAAAPAVDTSGWKTYTDSTYHFSFKYQPDWKILAPQKKNGYIVLQVDPGAKYYNFNIYISPDSFYIMDGLPYNTETIGGEQAYDVVNSLFGIKFNNTYYTFDVGQSFKLLPQFDALVHTVNFNG